MRFAVILKHLDLICKNVPKYNLDISLKLVTLIICSFLLSVLYYFEVINRLQLIF